MSKAREIAEERLAKGEITRKEFDEITSALSTVAQQREVPSSSISASPDPNSHGKEDVSISKAGWFYWCVPVLFIVPFRITQPEISQMGVGIQIVAWTAMGLGAIGLVKLIFGK